jgi:hypothetical protein
MLLLVAEEVMRYPQCYERFVSKTDGCESPQVLSHHCYLVHRVKVKSTAYDVTSSRIEPAQ